MCGGGYGGQQSFGGGYGGGFGNPYGNDYMQQGYQPMGYRSMTPSMGYGAQLDSYGMPMRQQYGGWGQYFQPFDYSRTPYNGTPTPSPVTPPPVTPPPVTPPPVTPPPSTTPTTPTPPPTPGAIPNQPWGSVVDPNNPNQWIQSTPATDAYYQQFNPFTITNQMYNNGGGFLLNSPTFKPYGG